MFSHNSRDGWCSEHVAHGSSTLKEPPTDDVERFLAMLRFDSREKLEDLGFDTNPNAH